MKPFCLSAGHFVRGEVACPGDKSISHRCIIFSAISQQKTVISNFPANDDCLSTVNVFRKLGIKINAGKNKACVFGKGLYGLKRFAKPVFVGESGTTLRLMLGVLAGQKFTTTLIAGSSLSKRPMKRVTSPLRLMGAKIKGRIVTRDEGRGTKDEEFPPLTISGGDLKAITYKMPIASAQVKSAILLAGLYAKGNTVVIEPIKSRDHTEHLLKQFGADLKTNGTRINLKGGKELRSPGKVFIPADISSAAFFMVLASLLPGSKLCLKNVSLNPSRLGVLKVLKKMGAVIQVTGGRRQAAGGEPMGDIIVAFSRLKGVMVRKNEIPSLIDELPILMVAASLAKGKTVFEGVEELRVKETDRLKSMEYNLRKMGADIKVLNIKGRENVVINGTGSLAGAKVKSFGDHRTAMSMVVAGLLSKGHTCLDDISCISKSYPGFINDLKRILR
ncbi:MAG: 3-phosphoshikimate 1-carboxyvinyltransferase [Candidatus Omnitrophica bacterium]|nr:3-phosphoshikimate 1-carboxyvinyltransferase [Candidatus Omnitrophota bacterium]